LYRPEAAAAANEFQKISIAGGPINDLNSTEIADQTGVEGNLDAETILGEWRQNLPLEAFCRCLSDCADR